MNMSNAVANEEDGDTEQSPGAKAPPERQRAPNASETHWAQGSADGLQRPVPKQFSEIDESASSQAAASPSMEAVGKQAYQDAMNGVDTDRGPVLDAVYNGPVTGGHRVGDKEEARDDRHPSDPARSKHP
jgi:hypothetical protein